MTKNNKKISSSDFKLWSQILDKVEPIKKSGRSIIQNQSKSIIDEDDRDSGDVTEQNTKIKKVRQSHVIDEKIPRTIHNNNHDKKTEFTGIHRRLEQKMSRGQIEIDSTLDLHGMTQQEALDATINFVKMAKKNNLRIVLIITGKGISKENTDGDVHGRNGRGVLNKNLPTWLQHSEIRNFINGYRYANAKHGGEGAYYLLLKT